MMKSLHIFVVIVLIFQVNISTAFLLDLFRNIFEGPPLYRPGYVQPSLYQPMGPNNQTLLEMGQVQNQDRIWPTAGIAGAFDNYYRPGGIGGFGGLGGIMNS